MERTLFLFLQRAPGLHFKDHKTRLKMLLNIISFMFRAS